MLGTLFAYPATYATIGGLLGSCCVARIWNAEASPADLERWRRESSSHLNEARLLGTCMRIIGAACTIGGAATLGVSVALPINAYTLGGNAFAAIVSVLGVLHIQRGNAAMQLIREMDQQQQATFAPVALSRGKYKYLRAAPTTKVRVR